jgi:hypothetical protein
MAGCALEVIATFADALTAWFGAPKRDEPASTVA